MEWIHTSMNVFVYGDSNVAGWDHSKPGLYPQNIQWPVLLQEKFNEKWPNEYKIHVNGVPGRKLASNSENLNSDIKQFQKVLKKVGNVDIFILMEGINDFSVVTDHNQVLQFVNKYIETCNAKHTIYVLHPGIYYERLPEMFQYFTKDHCESLIEAFNKDQEKVNAKIVTFDKKYLGDDGLHLTPEGNIQLVNTILDVISQLKAM